MINMRVGYMGFTRAQNIRDLEQISAEIPGWNEFVRFRTGNALKILD